MSTTMVPLLALAAAAAPPEQVHLAYGVAHDSMRVAWSTMGSAGEDSSVVQWGSAPAALGRSARGSATPFTQDAGRNWTQHVAEMSALLAGQRVWYRVGGGAGGWSAAASFVVNRGSVSQRVAWVGDMGAPFSHALCPACTNTEELCACGNATTGLVSEAARGAAAIIHVGTSPSLQGAGAVGLALAPP